MTSTSHSPSNLFHKSSRNESTSRGDGTRSSSKKFKGDQTTNSTTADSSRTHFTKTISSRHQPIPSSEARRSMQDASFHPNWAMPNPSACLTSENLSHYDPHHAEYTTLIANGAASLGVRVPAQLEKAIVNTHGDSSAWSVAPKSPLDQHVSALCGVPPGFKVVPYPQVVRYEHETRKWDGGLAGIGAQFDY